MAQIYRKPFIQMDIEISKNNFKLPIEVVPIESNKLHFLNDIRHKKTVARKISQSNEIRSKNSRWITRKIFLLQKMTSSFPGFYFEFLVRILLDWTIFYVYLFYINKNRDRINSVVRLLLEEVPLCNSGRAYWNIYFIFWWCLKEIHYSGRILVQNGSSNLCNSHLK